MPKIFTTTKNPNYNKKRNCFHTQTRILESYATIAWVVWQTSGLPQRPRLYLDQHLPVWPSSLHWHSDSFYPPPTAVACHLHQAWALLISGSLQSGLVWLIWESQPVPGEEQMRYRPVYMDKLTIILYSGWTDKSAECFHNSDYVLWMCSTSSW